MPLLWFLAAVALLVLLWIVGSYNRLVSLVQRTNAAWADIDVQLKLRYDLIPLLVETVKAYAAYEKSVFDDVTQARARAMSASSITDRENEEGTLSQSLKSLLAVAEAYPDLKANQNFLELQQQLTAVENDIQSARRFYNGNVRDLNTALQVFPATLVAGAFHFKQRDFFQLDAADSVVQNPVAVTLQS